MTHKSGKTEKREEILCSEVLDVLVLRLLRLLLYPESPVLHGSPKKKYKI